MQGAKDHSTLGRGPGASFPTSPPKFVSPALARRSRPHSRIHDPSLTPAPRASTGRAGIMRWSSASVAVHSVTFILLPPAQSRSPLELDATTTDSVVMHHMHYTASSCYGIFSFSTMGRHEDQSRMRGSSWLLSQRVGREMRATKSSQPPSPETCGFPVLRHIAGQLQFNCGHIGTLKVVSNKVVRYSICARLPLPPSG